MEKMKEKKEVRLSRTAIDNTIIDIERKMWKKCSVNTSFACIAPLTWYIGTDRASCEFLKLFINMTERQKSTVANKLIKARCGDYNKIINDICNYLGYKREGMR